MRMYDDTSNYIVPHHCNFLDAGFDAQELHPHINPSPDLPKFCTPDNPKDVVKEQLYWRKKPAGQDLCCDDTTERLNTSTDGVETVCNGAPLTQYTIQGLRAGAEKVKSVRAQHNRKTLFKDVLMRAGLAHAGKRGERMEALALLLKSNNWHNNCARIKVKLAEKELGVMT